MGRRMVLYRGSLKSCNYRCSYCPFSKHRMTEQELHKDRMQWEAFVQSYKQHAASAGIHAVMVVPYGEALIHPWYWEGLAAISSLSDTDAAGAQTNLSFPVSGSLAMYQRMGGNIEKLRLWATFHPEMVSYKEFASRCQQLYDAGVLLCAGAVGVPENMDILMQLRRELPEQVYLWINRMDGMQRAYTTQEIQDFYSIDPYFLRELLPHPADLSQCMERLMIEGCEKVRLCSISQSENLVQQKSSSGAVQSCKISKAEKQKRWKNGSEEVPLHKIGVPEKLGRQKSGSGEVPLRKIGMPEKLGQQKSGSGEVPLRKIGVPEKLGQQKSGSEEVPLRKIGVPERLGQQKSGSEEVQPCEISGLENLAQWENGCRDAWSGMPLKCSRKRCTCYLAYGGRDELMNQALFGPYPLYRIPRRAKAVFLDIEGTLLAAEPESVEAGLRALEREHIPVFFATTLPYKNAVQRCRRIRHYFQGGIFAAGAHVRMQVKGETKECFFYLDEACIPYLQDAACKHRCRMLRYCSQGSCYKLTLLRASHMPWEAGQAQALFGSLPEPVRNNLRYFVEGSCLQVTAAGIDKASGVKKVCSWLDIQPQEAFAAGDSPQDLCMIRLTESIAK